MIQIVASIGLLGMLGMGWVALRILRNAKALEADTDRQIARFHELWTKEREKHVALVEHLRSLVLIGEQDNDAL